MRRMRAGLLALLVVGLVLIMAGCQSKRPVPSGFDFTLEQTDAGLTIRAQTGDFRIPQDGHLHIQLDNGPVAMAYSLSYTIPKDHVPPGQHTVTVGLSDLQHNNLGEAKTKSIEIK